MENPINLVIEITFSSLIAEALRRGLEPNPVMGLMYLPDENATRQFQDACRSVLKSLGVNDGEETKEKS